jgi:cyclic-di-GMP phosphodiesterase TipF (flagellum assembly factor)
MRGTSLDRLTLLATHALSSAIFGFALTQYPGIEPLTGALAGGVVFLCLRHIYDTLSLSRDRREIAEDMNFIRAANLSVRGSLDDTRRKVTEITSALAKRAELLERKVAAELEQIEAMMNQLPVSTPAKSTVPVPAAPAHARTLGDPAMLDMIRRSLEENRVDLYLQPIVSLPQRKVRFYEALTRLRSADGSVVMPSQYIKVAAPAGLMSVVDNLLLFRCIQLVRRISQKSRDVAVFCNISEHTLKDAEFFPQFAEFLRNNRDLSSQIVFEFSQDTVLQAGKAVEEALKTLHGLGFRLSLDQVTRLDCSFSRLRAQGFHFIKVKARTILDGMKQANAPVSAEDLKDLLARAGIDLIVERVEEEKSVLQLLDFNIGYGQGFLFGEPRPVRDVGEIAAPHSKEPATTTTARPGAAPARRLAS